MKINNCILGKFEDNLDKIPLVDHIITDIPYNISRDSNFKGMKDRKNRIGLDFGEWDHSFDINKLKLLIPKLKEGGSFILFLYHWRTHQKKDMLQQKRD